MKRFTATEKWADPWYRNLHPDYKHLWDFICDSCEPDGVWTIDLEYAAAHVGPAIKFDRAEAERLFEARLLECQPGKWWVVKFIEFQYGKLNEKCHYHRKVAECLVRHNLVELFKKHYPHQSYPTSQPPSQSGGSPSPTGREGTVQEGIVQGSTGGESEGGKNLSPLGIRISGWFNRKPTTKWADDELRRLRKVEALKTTDDDLALLDAYYHSNSTILRRDISTLLNNWNGEIDRARAHSDGHAASDPPKSTWELNKIMEAKQKLAKELENRWTHEAPTGLEWNDPQKKQMWRDLQKEIKDLNNQIANPK